MQTESVRNIFPALSRKVYGRDLVYFDNAATAQKSDMVLEKWNRLSRESNANIHRAVHLLASEATDAYESARDKIRAFLNAASREEIIFTSGATMSLNLLATCFSEAFLESGDEIVVTEAEHHSNIVSWQMACQRKRARLKVLPVDDKGCLMLDKLDSLLTERTKLVSVTHVSNVLGIVNPVKDIIEICHSKNIPVCVDGAQGVVHLPVDVKDLDCDFYVFSGHKMYAATGTGVLYGKRKWLETMPPYMGGGEMVGTVSFENTTYAPLPMKYEAGTQNFISAATFAEAVETVGLLRRVEPQLDAVKSYLHEKLSSVPGLRIFGCPDDMSRKIPLFSFTVDGVHHEDLAMILDKMGIAARSGQMCAEPLMNRFGVTGMLRISLLPYNTMSEAEYFMASLEKAISMLK